MKQVQVIVESPKLDNSSAPENTRPHRTTSWLDKLRPWLLSVHLQSAVQIAAGIFVTCLFTFVRPITYPQSCVSATLYLVVSVMSSPNNHLGTRINAATSLMCSVWIGAVMAAVVATLSKLAGPGAGSTAIVAVVGSVAIALLSINRVGSQPPMLWSLGMVSTLAFGLVALSTWKIHTVDQVWIITCYILLTAVIAAVVSVLVAALIMPTLATEQVQQQLSDVLQSAGTATSRYAARLFRPRCGCPSARPFQQQHTKDAAAAVPAGNVHDSKTDKPLKQDQTAAAQEAEEDILASGYWYSPGVDVPLQNAASQLQRGDSIYSLGEVGAAFVLDDPMTDAQWLELIQRNSSPNPPPHPAAYACPLPTAHVGLLRPKLAEIQNLLLPAAAVEPPWMRHWNCMSTHHPWFDVAAWSKVVQATQLLLTRLSALEAVIEDGESLHESDSWTSSPELLSRLRLVYSQTATSLALMACTVKSFGNPSDSSKAAAPAAKDGSFCVMVGAFGAEWRRAKEELTEYMRGQTELRWKHMMSAAPGSPVVLPSLTNVRHLMFAWVLTNSVITATEQLERSLAAAVCNAPPPGLLRRLFGWASPLWPLLSGRYLFANWHKVLFVNLPAVVKQGSAGIHRQMSQPLFQAGVKYWLVVTLVYVATLVSMHFNSSIASLTPAFGYVAASLTMSEKVEATVSKVAFWLAGTAVGGALGIAAMRHPAVATNPYALMAIMVAAAFLVGLLGQTRARVTITLTLMTLSALILCQYNGSTAGRPEVAAARIVSVVAGVLTAVAVCNLILPWYMSTWAIQTMCHAYEHSIQILCEVMARSYQKGADAVAAAQSTCPSTRTQPGQPSPAAAAADLAAAMAASAAESFPDVERCGAARDPTSPAALQSEVAGPLVAVQVSLIRDTVAWQRGVLATPPIVPQLLRALQGLLDRLAALQLAYNPPSVTGVMTGQHTIRFGVPLKDKFIHLFELHGLLAAAVAAAVQHPESRTHCNAVKVLVKSIEQQRTRVYRHMTDLRKELLTQAFQRQQHLAAAAGPKTQQQQQQQQRQVIAVIPPDSPACEELQQQMCELFGTADDAVAYLGFQFALLKALDKTAAVAKVVMQDNCRIRNSTRSALV